MKQYNIPIVVLLFHICIASVQAQGTSKSQEDGPPSKKFTLPRSQKERETLLRDEGGNEDSEKAVALGLRWLALHQRADGSWGLHNFHKAARTEPLLKGKVVGDDSTPLTTRNNDVAATAFALLPFLAAGNTNKAPAKDVKVDYHQTVSAGLDWLVKKQSTQKADRGFFGGDIYSHALATLAVCEVYTITNDNILRASAQAAVDYLVICQDPWGGGWRYAPRQAGDLCVTGFVYRALVMAKHGGLTVPKTTMPKANKFVEAVYDPKSGGYSYIPDKNETATMSAVGVLCRLQDGMEAKNPILKKGLAHLRRSATPSEKALAIYYNHFSTLALFQVGGEPWKKWNLGNGKADKGMRRRLIELQDDGKAKPGNKGSWEGHDHIGGRLGATSLNLLSLQVYYRYPRLGSSE